MWAASSRLWVAPSLVEGTGFIQGAQLPPSDGIVSHLKKQAGPASVALREDGFERFISEKDAAVVGT